MTIFVICVGSSLLSKATDVTLAFLSPTHKEISLNIGVEIDCRNTITKTILFIFGCLAWVITIKGHNPANVQTKYL